MSIKTKLIAFVLSMLVAFSGFCFVYFPDVMKQQVMATLDLKVKNMAEMIALATGIGLGSQNFDAVNEAIAWAKRDEDLTYLGIMDSDGEELVQINPGNVQLNVRDLGNLTQPKEISGNIFHTVPITFKKEEFGKLTVGLSLDRLHKDIADNQTTTLYVCLFLLFVGSVFTFLFSNQLVKRLRTIKEAIEGLADGDLRQVPVIDRSSDELGKLGQAFNLMLVNLQRLLKQAKDLENGNLNSTKAFERLKKGMDFDSAADFVEEEYQAAQGDLAKAFEQMTKELRKLTVQAVVIANDDLNNPVLNDKISGELGEAFTKLTEKMKWVAAQAEYIARNDLNNENLVDNGQGTLGHSMASMVKNLRRTTTEMAKTESLMKQLPINVMYADTDFKIQYLNPSAEKTLKAMEGALPFKVENMIGQSIDAFHKNPQHVKNIISDPKNLPFRTNIQVNHDTLSLMVNPLFDENGGYFGPVVTWEVITERVRMEEQSKKDAEKMRLLIDHISQNAQTLASASEELSANSQQMAGNAKETSVQLGVASSASAEVNNNVERVARGTDELNTSIQEISRNANEAAHITNSAVQVAESANHTIGMLNESSTEIDQVIKLITNIAGQTNLLALNATIEAARAGEAGKGFAVVANEVKELAHQTSKATENISDKIEAIQGNTQNAVISIIEITKIINQINDICRTIASSVNEQTETATTMSQNITEASRGTAEISESIFGVTQVAQSTAEGASDSQKAAAELSRMASELQTVISDTNT